MYVEKMDKTRRLDGGEEIPKAVPSRDDHHFLLHPAAVLQQKNLNQIQVPNVKTCVSECSSSCRSSSPTLSIAICSKNKALTVARSFSPPASFLSQGEKKTWQIFQMSFLLASVLQVIKLKMMNLNTGLL